MTIRLAAVALGWLASASFGTGEPASASADVVLREIWAHPLPKQVRPTGVAVAPRGLLLWDTHGGRAVEFSWSGESYREWRVAQSGMIRAAAWSSQLEGWEALLADGTVLVLKDTVETSPLSPVGPVPRQSTPAFIDGHWHLIRFDSAAKALLVDGVPVLGSESMPDFLEPMDRLWILGAPDGGWLVTKMMPPFWAALLDRTGRMVRRVLETPNGFAGLPESGPPRALAMPVVGLGAHGFLQTITDLRSERRTIRFLDPQGLLVAEQEVAVPLVLVAAEVTGRRLVGVRDLGEIVEVVVYEWAMSPAP